MRIVDLDTGAPVGAGEAGEIQLRGRNMMRGICGRTRAEVFTDDGFYPTGDLGHLDADGYLFLSGRRDDMFKVRGATVYPSEVERALHAIADVRRAYVVDVDRRRLRRGRRRGGAGRRQFVHRRRPRRVTRPRASARSRCRQHWRVIGNDDVPMTSTGKVDKAGLQKLFE